MPQVPHASTPGAFPLPRSTSGHGDRCTSGCRGGVRTGRQRSTLRGGTKGVVFQQFTDGGNSTVHIIAAFDDSADQSTLRNSTTASMVGCQRSLHAEFWFANNPGLSNASSRSTVEVHRTGSTHSR